MGQNLQNSLWFVLCARKTGFGRSLLLRPASSLLQIGKVLKFQVLGDCTLSHKWRKPFFDVLLDFRTPRENFVLVNVWGFVRDFRSAHKSPSTMSHQIDPTNSIKFILPSNKTESMDI